MTKWIAKQETEYLELGYDAYQTLGALTFFSPASPEEGFYDDRELGPEEVVEILMRLDEVFKIMEGKNT